MMVFDRVAAGTIATQDAPEIDAATPVRLRQSTETLDLRFPAMLVGYIRVSSDSGTVMAFRPVNWSQTRL
jgi:hypothetical protein